MPSLLEIWESRLGIKEVPGKGTNPLIDEWCADAGHPELDDNDAWCSVAMASAAKAAGLPFPPPNVNPAARSWLTMGVRVAPGDVQPGDVVVWPRGKASWKGHVNCVQDVRHRGGKVEVRAIGGNQSNAVTLTGWADLAGALPNGVRRLVPVSVKALRPHSSEIKKGDRIQNGGWLVTAISALVATIKELLAPVQVPQFAALPDALTWWQSIMGGANAVWSLVAANPWLAGTVIVGIICVLAGRQLKSKRVEKHAAGVPISSEALAMVA
jgi:uncharacterized protein (TIGR02594 family)